MRNPTVNPEAPFRVSPKFPRLAEADMPPGVGDANYALSVAACEPFRVELSVVEAALAAKPRINSKRRSRD